jgi:Rps23 Pro-64 3,4-dihydroxylase Tpa1-like proline 4-hydroxylase
MFDVENPFPGILRYRQFLSASECLTYVDRAKSADKWTAAAIGRYQDNQLVEKRIDTQLRDVQVCDLEPIGFRFPTPAVHRLREDIVKRLDIPIDLMSRGMISKYSVGSHIRPHRDTGMYSTNRLVTCVAYLNDEYLGGALTFPQFSYSIAPQLGECVCFYSEYLHGVDEITFGVRYCVVWFGESSLVAIR